AAPIVRIDPNEDAPVSADPADDAPSADFADRADSSDRAPIADGARFVDGAPFADRAERRLRRWHRQLAAEIAAFDSLDGAGLHELRKRIKRQRYAVEFFAPVLRHRRTAAYLKRLRPAQERMGELNDLFVARARYQSMPPGEAGAWFAQGWLAARIDAALASARIELQRLARCDPPRA
ncbi:MAG: CHAD domain-containing protein, partial [Burkholderiaceae bacterium]